MRRKSKNTKRTAKSSSLEEGKMENDAEPLVLDVSVHDKADEMADMKARGDLELEDKDIKDDSDRVIAVIDKKPAGRSNVTGDRDDDNGDAPKDVSWKASRESAIQELKKEKERFQESKQKEKLARIERNEKLLEQKQRKRAREYSRLPTEVLQHIAKQQESQAKEDVVQSTVPTGNHVTFDSDDEQEEETEIYDEEPPVKVLVLPKETEKPKKIQQSAKLFLREQLFGNRIQRISAVRDLDRRKTGFVFNPATNFARKSKKIKRKGRKGQKTV